MNPKKFIVLLLLANVVSITAALGVRHFFIKPVVAPATVPPVEQPTAEDAMPKKPEKEDMKPLKPEPPPLVVTGMLRKGNRITVVMSDGTTRTEQDNVPARVKDPFAGKELLTYATRNFVVYDNKRLYLTPNQKPEKPAQAVKVAQNPKKEEAP